MRFFFFPNDAYWIGEGGGMWLYISRQNNARNGNGGQCMHGLLTKKQLLLAKVQLIPCHRRAYIALHQELRANMSSHTHHLSDVFTSWRVQARTARQLNAYTPQITHQKQKGSSVCLWPPLLAWSSCRSLLTCTGCGTQCIYNPLLSACLQLPYTAMDKSVYDSTYLSRPAYHIACSPKNFIIFLQIYIIR